MREDFAKARENRSDLESKPVNSLENLRGIGAAKTKCMKSRGKPSQAHAFTLIELLIVILVLVVLAMLIVPAFMSPTTPAYRIRCVNNLKQVGLAFRVWGGEYQDKFPMEVSTKDGGTMELADSGNVIAHFQILSNELQNPKVLVCPKENKESRKAATNFTADLDNSKLSYFVGIDANPTNYPEMFLSGDRNITNGLSPRNGILTLTTNEAVGWTDRIHNCAGNLLFVDGHVEQLNNAKLREALQNTGVATNRLAIP
jgi:prepilin-type N-terminal cleavage/methylation domain-containing protein/prepilin-type processing-associated H-X9-DG protein